MWVKGEREREVEREGEIETTGYETICNSCCGKGGGVQSARGGGGRSLYRASALAPAARSSAPRSTPARGMSGLERHVAPCQYGEPKASRSSPCPTVSSLP